MAAQSANPRGPGLEPVEFDKKNWAFTTPTKRINDGDDLTFFLASTAYRDLMTWLLQLNRSAFPVKHQNGTIQECKLDSPPAYSPFVEAVRQLLSSLSDLTDQAPPDKGPRRFGNVAFRTWVKLAEEGLDDLMDAHLKSALDKVDDGQQSYLKDELKFYLLGSFGSAQRLDYGTGHELSFIAFLGCLWKLGSFENGEERAIVVGLVQPYLELIRRLVMTYTLEPAGSHGVWGLDDHSFGPYIFGSAQYGPAVDPEKTNMPMPTEGSSAYAPSPTAVTDKAAVSDYQASNMYFSAIQFIYDVKRGPFWEHSPVLYDVSGIKDGWAKINKGMLKMYAAEVLGKFPVVQHFGFGSFFRWEMDPNARREASSEHARTQPKARSMDVPPPPPAQAIASGTRAPWARGGGAADPSTGAGMPPSKAGWAAERPGSSVFTAPRTTAPWAASQRAASRDNGKNAAAAARASHDHG